MRIDARIVMTAYDDQRRNEAMCLGFDYITIFCLTNFFCSLNVLLK
jgi:hypothetical protein